jgi:hypothetical protein
MRSTYKQLIDDAILDINQDAKTSSLNERKVQDWINRWSQKIARRMSAEDTITVYLQPDLTLYPIELFADEIQAVRYIRRHWGDKKQKIDFVALERLLEIQRKESLSHTRLSDMAIPAFCAIQSQGGKEFFLFHPAPLEPEEATVYIWRGVNVRERNKLTLVKEVPLQHRYDTLLKLGVCSEIAQHTLKDFDLRNDYLARYEEELRDLGQTDQGDFSMRMEYR